MFFFSLSVKGAFRTLFATLSHLCNYEFAMCVGVSVCARVCGCVDVCACGQGKLSHSTVA